MKKIGLIDSGIGGLTLLRELIHHKIEAEYLYLSDTHNVPYGEKPQSFLLEKMTIMSEKLITKNVDAIVIACNTATAETIDDLRMKFDIPFIGIEPYINYLNHTEAIEKTALILTPATARSQRFINLKGKYDPSGSIDIIILDRLALIIEKLMNYEFKELEPQIYNEISPLMNKGYKKLILGCTHYPIIKHYLEEKLKLETVDPSINVINHIKNQFKLEAQGVNPPIFYANFDNSDQWQDYRLSNFKFLNL